VFVVGYLGDWRPAAAVLFERDSLQGNPAPSRKKRESIAVSTRAVSEGYGIDRVEVINALCASDAKGVGNQYLADHKCVVQPIALASGVHGVAQILSYDMKQHHNPQPSDTVQLTTSNCATVRGDTPLVQPTYALQGNMIGRNDKAGPQGDGVNVEVCFTQNTTDRHAVAYNIAPGKGELKDDIHVTDAYIAKTIDASGSNPAMHQGGAAIVQPIPFDTTQITSKANYSKPQQGDPCHPLAAGAHPPAIAQTMAVRRLTPVECERLQGFPDGYTNIPWRKAAESPDGPRYKALGNSWAVPVVAWLGQRIKDQLQ
jgi:DNA (cytosine-5)-methyltransferase 1